MSDAAWALENVARAKQTLPNGYCGLPLQQSCPHPNACLACDSLPFERRFAARRQGSRRAQITASTPVPAMARGRSSAAMNSQRPGSSAAAAVSAEICT
jgi:hypothetical protein